MVAFGMDCSQLLDWDLAQVWLMLGQLVEEIHALATGPAMVTGPSSETLIGRSWLLSCSRNSHSTHNACAFYLH